MNLKKEIQNLKNRKDKIKHKLETAFSRNDKDLIERFQSEINDIEKKLTNLLYELDKDLVKKISQLEKLSFSRVLTKEEQADIGKLKKSVKGLVVVHPLTSIGKKIGVQEVTGFAKKRF
ncbi:YibL family ribosome-associated protein [Paraphotobacterium marinum]|uniref:YibL family ribosome-associated protein n=1 Tax=Paraphotobacterium marinum TaxID=1755811 RepID=UPI0039EC0168